MLRKDTPDQAVADAQPSQPADIMKHPLFTGAESVSMLSADNPRFPVLQPGGHEALGNHLQSLGVSKAIPTDGKYETPEKSYIVHGATREQMFDLGNKLGQESVVHTPIGGKPEMLYTNGPKAGRFCPAKLNPDGSLKFELFDTPPEDYYTKFDPHGYLRLDFDFDTLHPAPLQEPFASQALAIRAAAEAHTQKSELERVWEALKKSLMSGTPSPTVFPHAYPWFNSRTDQAMKHGAGGVLSSSIQKAEEPPTHFGKSAVQFGSVSTDRVENLHHYPLQGKGPEVDQLVRDYGYQSHKVGGRHGRPDLASKNYDTKWLPIHDHQDENPAGEEHVNNWRKLHELSHALTEPKVDQIYGPGKRAGVLGQHRTQNEMLRAVHWEYLAGHQQRELAKQIGVHIPEETFNREMNTLMADSIHRAATGEVIDPSSHGFKPHSHPIPLETALGAVKDSAHNLRLTGMHDLSKTEGATTVANEKEIDVVELKKQLAKMLRDQISKYELSLLDLRKRELAKAEHAPMTLCKECKKSGDLCKCAKKSELCPKSKMIAAPGSGGQRVKGKIPKGLKKADVPMAKPPGGNPMAVPASKPAAPAPAKPAAAPGLPAAKSEDNTDKYNYYIVHTKTGAIRGGNEYKEDAQDAAKDHSDTGSLKVTHRSKVDSAAKEKFHRDSKIMDKLHKDELEKKDFKVTGDINKAPSVTTGGPAKPKFDVNALGAAKGNMQAAGVKPISPLGLPGTGALKAPPPPPPIGAAPAIPAAAAAPGIAPPMAAPASARSTGLQGLRARAREGAAKTVGATPLTLAEMETKCKCPKGKCSCGKK